ncbi:MAG: polyhydroxyalkanoate synthesis regulator [Thermincola sp.]|jgi:polyhydroxyalkanoate synthesis regulator phasin|nr:polyhydroxyalkanoate synthesis regulator [Thermincola sp.]
MKGLLKKTLLVGMGALSLTREKAEKIVRELEEKGEVTSEEAKQFINELADRGEQERNALKEVVAAEFEKFKNMTGMITKKDLAALEERLTRLEQSTGISLPETGPNQRPPVELPPTQ